MYSVQNRIYCGVCNKSYIPKIYPNQLKSQGHVNNLLKNKFTNSMIIKTQFMKIKWKQNLLTT